MNTITRESFALQQQSYYRYYYSIHTGKKFTYNSAKGLPSFKKGTFFLMPLTLKNMYADFLQNIFGESFRKKLSNFGKYIKTFLRLPHYQDGHCSPNVLLCVKLFPRVYILLFNTSMYR